MRTRKLYLFMLAVAAVLTACTNEDNFTNEQLPNTGNEAHTYTVNIPASMGEGAQTRAVTFNNDATPPTATGRFDEFEEVYVYNETKGVMLSGVLRPSNISTDGKSCNLTGELTGSFDAGDQLTLLYNMIYYTDPAECFFYYDRQDGSESGVVDGGMATGVSATISGSTLTTATTVTFAMQQAIFRLKFTDGTNPINVKSLIIKCTGSDVASCYNPFNNEPYIYSEQSIKVIPTTATSEYLYVALCINENASPSGLTFTVTDDDGDVYTASKAAPSSGFKNGKYYYSSDATVLTWQKKLVKPTITNITNVDYAGEFGPDLIGNFYYLLPVNNENPLEITISGTSNGYWFSANGGNAIIHLNNLTATHDSNYFIDAVNLILDISGANSITCKNEAQAIEVYNTLKLMGNGTLTVTANNSELYGLYAESNYQDGNNSDASVLAAPGFTVTRSERTDNDADNDGITESYTWTYTVYPVGAINGKFTVNNSGKQVYFSKGNLQATYDGSAWSWAFAANQWDYIGNAEGNTKVSGSDPFVTGYTGSSTTVDLFGWSTSTTYLGIHKSRDDGDYSGDFVDWGSHADVTAGIGSGWCTLSKDEWLYLFYGRSDAENKYGYATVNGVYGIIFLPDAFVDPKKNNGSDAFVGSATDWVTNVYTAANWALMEKNGAVFLPAAGYRDEADVFDDGDDGWYWSSSAKGGDEAYYLYFAESDESDDLVVDNFTDRYNGHSVRLVRPVQ